MTTKTCHVYVFSIRVWLSGEGDGLVPSKPGFISHWYPYESLVAKFALCGLQSCKNRPTLFRGLMS